MNLIIDTTGKEVEIALLANGKSDSIRWDGAGNLSETLLLKIGELLKRNSTDKQKISKIVVSTGPGSYTGLRIGVTTANFIAFSLNVPVVETCARSLGTEFAAPLIPKYGNEPFITKQRPRL